MNDIVDKEGSPSSLTWPRCLQREGSDIQDDPTLFAPGEGQVSVHPVHCLPLVPLPPSPRLRSHVGSHTLSSQTLFTTLFLT